MNQIAEEILMHYGMPRRSGRYPWGSGQDPYQHGRDFISRVEELKKQGWTETPENIKAVFGMTTTQYRTEYALANNERKMLKIARAKSLSQDGLGPTEIGRQMGESESTIRSWLKKDNTVKMTKAKETADIIRKEIENKGMIDVGTDVERELGISKEKLKQALHILEEEGYPIYSGRIPQATNPGQYTTQKVICPKGTEHKEIYNYDQVHTLKEYISRDGGETFEKKFYYPESLDSKRVKVLLADEIGPDGEPGIAKDGIIQLRRGVPDLSLGESRYSQVRILVDNDKYLKGMAVYSDNMPDGIDVIFNSNKHKVEDAYKAIKSDPDNPFGSAIKDVEQGGQYWYDPKTGARVSSNHPGAKLGLINKRADEGDWSDWKDALPSQFLGKQSKKMAEKQLELAKADKVSEYEEICALTNPTVKKHLLSKFADNCDAAAVDLQAAALPGQKYHVIVPINSLKDNEVYAPNYDNGTKLALVRYPHGGTFEIPILTVNNKHAAARKLLGSDVGDAVGINKKVADRLSGADFDGDTVMCIPTHDSKGRVKITSTPPLKGLEGFDPTDSYGPHTYKGKEVRLMTKKGTQTQMGIISNLITDMTLAGATDAELAAAVRHSMVVIDAHKHKLDYKQSEIDNNIAALHKNYQGKSTGGASTILSRSKGQKTVLKRQGNPVIDPETGKVSYKLSDDLYYPDRTYDKTTRTVTLRTTAGKKITYSMDDKSAVEKYTPVKRVDPDTGEITYSNKAGNISYKLKTRTQKSTKMAETDDAYTLVSDARHPMEIVYADYANSMKALANQARKEMVSTGKIKYSSTAKALYKDEVQSLSNKLNTAKLNTVRERAAQRMTAAEVQSKKKAGQLTDSGDVKKANARAIAKYRQEVGAVTRKKRNIEITDREWDAIQAGAVSENVLKQILDNADIDKLRERATPRSTTQLSQAKVNRIKAYSASNYSIAEIANKLGVSPSTVSKYL